MENQKFLFDLEQELKKITDTSLGRRAFLAALALSVTSCAKPARTRYREGDNTGQETRISVADERRMTQEILPAMRKDYPPISDAMMQKYVQELGQELVEKNKLSKNPYDYDFSVVGVSYVNAFALPAGTVFVTVPLMAMAETEAELVGVLGHEVGHIQARHAAERIDLAEREKNKTILTGVGGGVLGGLAGFGLGKLLCPPRDAACLAKATAGGVAAGAGVGLLIRKYAFMANSREDELEADRISFRTATKAGYSKDHVGLFYEKLLQMEEASKTKKVPLLSSLEDAMSTHPPSRERVEQINELRAKSSSSDGKISSKLFSDVKDRAQAWVKANPPKKR
jgi:predicted Zn-dependent protease